MSTLTEQIAFLESEVAKVIKPDQIIVDILKTIKFMALYETEIRAGAPVWKIAKTNPAVASLVREFPGAAMRLNNIGAKT